MERRSFDSASCCFSRSTSYNRARRTLNAFSRFLICDFSSWQLTTVFVGRCVNRTAEYVVFTDWPPGPEEQNVSMRTSFASILMSTSSASGMHRNRNRRCVHAALSLRGAEHAAPRCTPPSYFRREYAPWPITDAITSFKPPTPDSDVESTLYLPALRFCVPGVHAEQLGSRRTTLRRHQCLRGFRG